MRTKPKTLGQIAYEATPDEGGKSNFGPWSKAPAVVRRVHEQMAKAIERHVLQHIERDREVNRLQAEAFEEECRRIGVVVGSSALAKACVDPFDYAIKLRTGEIHRFTSAKIIDREWVHLINESLEPPHISDVLPYPAPRGVDVRLSDIVWVMDAPMGS